MNSEGERSSLVLEKPNWDVFKNADRCKIRSDRERESREEEKKASAVLRLTFAGKRLAPGLHPVAQVRLSGIYVEALFMFRPDPLVSNSFTRRLISWRLRRFRTLTSPISVMPTVHQKTRPAR